MSEKSQALRLINDLLADIRDPDFVWQILALLACLCLAWLIASWWRGRHAEGPPGECRDEFPVARLPVPVCTLGRLRTHPQRRMTLPALRLPTTSVRRAGAGTCSALQLDGGDAAGSGVRLRQADR